MRIVEATWTTTISDDFSWNFYDPTMDFAEGMGRRIGVEIASSTFVRTGKLCIPPECTSTTRSSTPSHQYSNVQRVAHCICVFFHKLERIPRQMGSVRELERPEVDK